jgi:inorganic phosphate transporter, PiT family
MVLATLVVSILLTLGLTIAAIPVSFSNTMVGAFVGAAFASAFAIRAAGVATIVVFWAAAPVATMAVTFLAYKVIERATANKSLLTVDAINRAGVGLVSLALAYVLSANNIGLIFGTAFATAGGFASPAGASSLALALGLAVCAIVAMAAFGRGKVAGTVGDRLLCLSPQGVLAAFTGSIIMMLVATQLGIPISVTQCLIGGMFGAASTKKISIVNRRISLEVIASWAVIPVVAFVLAVLITPLV